MHTRKAVTSDQIKNLKPSKTLAIITKPRITVNWRPPHLSIHYTTVDRTGPQVTRKSL